MWKEQHAANISRRWKHLPDATVDRAESLANECRSRLINAVEAVAKECQDNPKQNHRKLPQRTLGILLSGGVDSTAILEACQVANISLHDFSRLLPRRVIGHSAAYERHSPEEHRVCDTH